MTFPGSQWYYGWNSTWSLAFLPDPKKELDTKVWRRAGRSLSEWTGGGCVWSRSSSGKEKGGKAGGQSCVWVCRTGLHPGTSPPPHSPWISLPVECLVSNYILCLLQISLGLEPLKKNQLFNFESQALYRERPISASIGKKMELGNGLAGCYHLRSGRSAFCEVWVFPFIFKVGVYRIRGPPWEISFPPRGWGDNRMATPPRPASRESV